MDGRLQLRVQRYGWDRASARYEDLWREALAPATQGVLRLARLQPGERVLDVACGSGVLTRAARAAVGPRGEAVGCDVSAGMVAVAQAASIGCHFLRTDAQTRVQPGDAVGLAVEPANAHWFDAKSEDRLTG